MTPGEVYQNAEGQLWKKHGVSLLLKNAGHGMYAKAEHAHEKTKVPKVISHAKEKKIIDQEDR